MLIAPAPVYAQSGCKGTTFFANCQIFSELFSFLGLFSVLWLFRQLLLVGIFSMFTGLEYRIAIFIEYHLHFLFYGNTVGGNTI